MSNYEKTHLCGSIYAAGNTGQTGVACPYLLYVTNDESYIGKKKLRKYYVYCRAEGRCRSMGCAASWTGCSPKWCPKRQAMESEVTSDA